MINSLLRGQRAALWYLLLVAGVPMVTLLGMGVVHIWQQQWFLMLSVLWLAVTLFGYAIYRLWPQHKNRELPETHASESASAIGDNDILSSLPNRLEARADWSSIDRAVWPLAVDSVEKIIADKPSWNQLPELALELLSKVSRHYHQQTHLNSDTADTSDTYSHSSRSDKDAYQFTLPEMLLLLSVTSERYRDLLLTYLPFAEKIRVSALLQLYAKQDQIKTGARWVSKGHRIARFVNPVAALTAELRDHFTQRIFTNLSDKVQIDLKRLLLQELAQVGMDLYSGRLKSSAEELSSYQSQSQKDDLRNQVEPVEPLRVVLIGQISAGKSSLVNALTKTMQAETDILPTTDSTTVHTLNLPAGANQVDGDNTPVFTADSAMTDMHLIDTPGLIDEPASIEATTLIARQADLIIWVTRATQPAKSPEALLYKSIKQSRVDEPQRRPPSMLLIVSHVDQLRPQTLWQPPYDLASDEPKAQNIKAAIDSCKQQIGFETQTPTIPVSLSPKHPPYNIDALIGQLLELRNEAVLAQLNRRRIERASVSGGWRARWQQASNLGTVTGKLLTRSFRDT